MLHPITIPPPGFNHIISDKTEKKTFFPSSYSGIKHNSYVTKIESSNHSSAYCNNCGKYGHSMHSCKTPITSLGIICFRINPATNAPEYLMIRRKDTLGYIDFIRGKYSLYNKEYIINMLKQMTNDEKQNLKIYSFHKLWCTLWNTPEWENITKQSPQYNHEEYVSREKFNSLVKGIHSNGESYNLASLIEESNQYSTWEEAEWGFPKGRRNYQEKDYDCAIREFCEETGYSSTGLTPLKNILPFEELFIGSNYKSYKHKYYVKYMNYSDSLNMPLHQSSEVSKMKWNTYAEAIKCIRTYNIEKIKILENIHMLISITEKL